MLDRGIRFGVTTKMPMHNILIALPVEAKWVYGWEAKYTKEDYPTEYNILQYLGNHEGYDWLSEAGKETLDCVSLGPNMIQGTSIF